MAGSSYFQAIAPTAGTTPAARLAPAPPLFRPSAAPAFLATDSWSEPPRQGPGARRAAPEERATRPDGAAAAPPDRPDSPVSEKPDSGDRTRPAAPVDAASVPTRITRSMPGAVPPSPTTGPEPARPPGAVRPWPAIGAEPRRPPGPSAPGRPRDDAVAGARPAPRAPSAGAPQPTSEPERPRRSPQAAAGAPTAPPAIMPQPPAPRPSAKPGPSGPTGGVHIGTLEVRVVAPAAPARAAPPPAGRPRFAARAPAPRQTWGSTRLSRGFAVFGLGQS